MMLNSLKKLRLRQANKFGKLSDIRFPKVLQKVTKIFLKCEFWLPLEFMNLC